MQQNRLIASLLVALGSLAMTGCVTVGPDYKIPEDAVVNKADTAEPFASGQNRAFSQNPLPDHWWRLYDDPMLNSLIEKALAENTDLRIAQANLARSRAVLEEVEMGRIPQVDLSAQPKFGRSSAAANGVPHRYADKWTGDTGINVSYQLDLFGKISRGIESASASADAAQAAYDLVQVTVAADTAKAYADACSSAYRVKIAQRSAGLLKDFHRTTKQLAQAGRSSVIEVARVAAQYESMNATIPPLQAQQRLAIYRLSVLTGEVPTALVSQVGQCSRIPQLKQPIPIGDGAELIRRRPDIRQAERNLAAANAKIGVATADLYPSINLGLSGGITSRLSDFGETNTYRWGFGPLISWTIPDTGTARARIKEAEADTQAAYARFDATVLNALRETESSLTTYARELERNASLKAARDQSALASSQTSRLYKHGRIDFLSKLDAERAYVIAEAAYAASSAQLADDQIAIFLALGGGWEQNDEQVQQIIAKNKTAIPDKVEKTIEETVEEIMEGNAENP
ncbi:MAG: efflux transporter outer membrane subunit [Oxalobacter sp.]|nr:efflux transporter outer membrane subunit [Oxalobacter sp.]